MSIKSSLKKVILSAQEASPHHTIYSFHHLSSHPEIELSGRKLDTENFKSFVMTHGPYVSVEALLRNDEFDGEKALTFDDGLSDLYTVAYPFLDLLHIPFTAFVLSEKIGNHGYITEQQLIELSSNPLVTIGSHGVTHRKMADIPLVEQIEELRLSKKTIEEITGKPCKWFCYPSGSYTKETIEEVKKAGYEFAFAVKGRHITKSAMKKVYEIPRLSVSDETVFIY